MNSVMLSCGVYINICYVKYSLDRRTLRRSSCGPLVPGEGESLGLSPCPPPPGSAESRLPVAYPRLLPRRSSLALQLGSASPPALPEAESPLHRSLHHREADKFTLHSTSHFSSPSLHLSQAQKNRQYHLLPKFKRNPPSAKHEESWIPVDAPRGHGRPHRRRGASGATPGGGGTVRESQSSQSPQSPSTTHTRSNSPDFWSPPPDIKCTISTHSPEQSLSGLKHSMLTHLTLLSFVYGLVVPVFRSQISTVSCAPLLPLVLLDKVKDWLLTEKPL